MLQDLYSKPTQGRYFPATFAELVSEISQHNLTVHYGRRINIRLQNCNVECDLGYQLCTFMRMSYIAVFSLPESVPRPLSHAARAIAIGEFAQIDKTPHHVVRDQEFIVYRAYLGALGCVTIAQHIISGGNHSYLQFQRAATLSKTKRSPKQQVVLVQRAVPNISFQRDALQAARP
jgi:hypothetical protein